MTTPEQRARLRIDELLAAAGWSVQDVKQADLHAARGVAIREFELNAGFGTADYLLYVDGRAAGVIEAKKEGASLAGVEIQSAKYAQGLPASLPAWRSPLVFLYESTGVETHFTNGLDPEPRARNVFAFHRPDALAARLDDALGRSGLQAAMESGTAATPNKQTFGFFNQNLVMEYGHPQAVADGVNVNYDVYRIKTEVTEAGSKVEAGYWLQVPDKPTRARRDWQLDDDFEYAPEELDRSVQTFDQIRSGLSGHRACAMQLAGEARSGALWAVVNERD